MLLRACLCCIGVRCPVAVAAAATQDRAAHTAGDINGEGDGTEGAIDTCSVSGCGTVDREVETAEAAMGLR